MANRPPSVSRRPEPTGAASGGPPPVLPTDLLVAAGRWRTVLASGFLAGVCVFFAPLLLLALGLLAAYLSYLLGDGTAGRGFLSISRPFTADDFRGVFAPAIDDAPLLVLCGLVGMLLAAVRRHLARRADPVLLAAGIRPFFPEFVVLYAVLIAGTVATAALRGGPIQIHRLMGAGPVFLLFLLCAAWLAHAVWHYCFQNVVDLLSSRQERVEAAALGARARLRPAGS